MVTNDPQLDGELTNFYLSITSDDQSENLYLQNFDVGAKLVLGGENWAFPVNKDTILYINIQSAAVPGYVQVIYDLAYPFA